MDEGDEKFNDVNDDEVLPLLTEVETTFAEWESVVRRGRFIWYSTPGVPYTFSFLLDVLDLHSNYLKGEIPVPPRRVYHLDYPCNNFGSSIPFDFGNVLRSILKGEIPVPPRRVYNFLLEAIILKQKINKPI
ncbi:hypothetical protein LXL04_012691 [Taraxacum kok-saghyz]